MSEPTQKFVRNGYRIGTPVAGVLVLIYFLCPYMYVWPIVLVYGKDYEPPPWINRTLNRAFYPVGLLGRHLPAYRELLAKEGKWFGFND